MQLHMFSQNMNYKCTIVLQAKIIKEQKHWKYTWIQRAEALCFAGPCNRHKRPIAFTHEALEPGARGRFCVPAHFLTTALQLTPVLWNWTSTDNMPRNCHSVRPWTLPRRTFRLVHCFSMPWAKTCVSLQYLAPEKTVIAQYLTCLITVLLFKKWVTA